MVNTGRITRRGSAVAVFSLVAGGLAACGEGFEEYPEPQVEEEHEFALVQRSGAGTWPRGEIKARIITDGMAAWQIEWLQDRIRQKFGETWGRAANLYLDFYPPVARKVDVPNGELGIGLDPKQSSTGLADVGYASDRPVLMHFNKINPFDPDPKKRDPSDFIIIHELGHVLGFEHEKGSSCSQQASGNSLTPVDTGYSVMAFADCWRDMADKVQLSHWDEIGVRRLYGRKPPGMLVGMNNQCLDLTDERAVTGQPLQTFGCHGGRAQNWKYGFGERSLAANLSGASTMEVKGLSTRPGPIVQAANQRHDGDMRNQRWRFTNASIKGFGGKCLDVLHGVFQSGQAVNLVDCNGTAAQKFELAPATSANAEEYQIWTVGRNFCVLPSGTGTGSVMRLETCPTSGNRFFYLMDDGFIRFSTRQGFCISAIGDDPNVDMPLRLGRCQVPGSPNFAREKQQYVISGNVKSDLGPCLSAGGTDFENRTGALTKACSSSRDLVWDYYWRQDQ